MNTQIIFSCPVGFRGETCTENINECNETANPCQNNGTCQDGLGDFSCVCGQGWTGKACEQDLNECDAFENLCNNGVCFNEVGKNVLPLTLVVLETIHC